MKTRRVELQSIFEKIIGNNHVYYQPPESLKMEYPCIRYSKSDIRSNHADNIKYNSRDCYEVIVIDKKPDSDIVDKILQLEYSSYSRHYVSDNLHHDSIRLYY